jgi:hypothetical protein
VTDAEDVLAQVHDDLADLEAAVEEWEGADKPEHIRRQLHRLAQKGLRGRLDRSVADRMALPESRLEMFDGVTARIDVVLERLRDPLPADCGTATFIRRLPEWRADARLFRLSKEAEYYEREGLKTAHVIVSGIRTLEGPETLVFPATESGEQIGGRMAGSFVGAVDHARALRGLGFTVVDEPK